MTGSEKQFAMECRQYWEDILKDLKTVGWKDGVLYTEDQLFKMLIKLYGPEERRFGTELMVFLNQTGFKRKKLTTFYKTGE